MNRTSLKNTSILYGIALSSLTAGGLLSNGNAKRAEIVMLADIGVSPAYAQSEPSGSSLATYHIAAAVKSDRVSCDAITLGRGDSGYTNAESDYEQSRKACGELVKAGHYSSGGLGKPTTVKSADGGMCAFTYTCVGYDSPSPTPSATPSSIPSSSSEGASSGVK
jgi:hypothetical protein